MGFQVSSICGKEPKVSPNEDVIIVVFLASFYVSC